MRPLPTWCNGRRVDRPAVAEVTRDGSPHGARTIALWEPELRDDLHGENGAPVRRAAGAEAARMLADLVAEGARTLGFVRSRRGAELTALGQGPGSRRSPRICGTRWPPTGPAISPRTGGEIERALAEGELRGLATTNALELGIDISGLDAVVMAGFPERWPRSGSKPAGVDDAARARW